MDEEHRKMIEELEALRQRQAKKVPAYLEDRRKWVEEHLVEQDEVFNLLKGYRQTLVDLQDEMAEDTEKMKRRMEVSKVLSEPNKGWEPIPEEQKESWKKIFKHVAARQNARESTNATRTNTSGPGFESATSDNSHVPSPTATQASDNVPDTSFSETLDDSSEIDESVSSTPVVEITLSCLNGKAQNYVAPLIMGATKDFQANTIANAVEDPVTDPTPEVSSEPIPKRRRRCTEGKSYFKYF